MTAAQKRRFIRELIGNVRDEIIAKTEKMPEEWNGIELRRFVADKFHDCVGCPMDKRRLHDYNNEVIVRNL